MCLYIHHYKLSEHLETEFLFFKIRNINPPPEIMTAFARLV